MDEAKLPSESPPSSASRQPTVVSTHAGIGSAQPLGVPAVSVATPAPTPPVTPAKLSDPSLQPRVYQPADIACRHQNEDFTNCGAEPGEPCTWQQAGEQGTWHAERIEDAAAISHGGGMEPTEEAFDQAAWDSGLF